MKAEVGIRITIQTPVNKKPTGNGKRHLPSSDNLGLSAPLRIEMNKLDARSLYDPSSLKNGLPLIGRRCAILYALQATRERTQRCILTKRAYYGANFPLSCQRG